MSINANAQSPEVFRTRISFPGFTQSVVEDILYHAVECHKEYFLESKGVDIPADALFELDFSDARAAVADAYFSAYVAELNARLSAEGFSALRLDYVALRMTRDPYAYPDYIEVRMPVGDLCTLRRYADTVTAWDQRMYPGGREETFEEYADRCANGGYAAFPHPDASAFMTWEQAGVLFDFCLSDEELFRSCNGALEDLSLVAYDALAAQFADLAERVRAGCAGEFDDAD